MRPEIWAVWPSAQHVLCDRNAKRWQTFGCRVAVLIDTGTPLPLVPEIVLTESEWKGYPAAMNALCKVVSGPIVICAADDVHPPTGTSLDKVYGEFLERFPDTFGIMQPTGDRFGSIDQVCPSPWIGRAFIDEAYGGAGPFWEEYFHYFCDEELKLVAEKMGVLWQRPDLSQFHDHWQREEDGGKRPPHLMQALEKHKSHRKLFQDRLRNGFSGHERRKPECH